MSTHTHARRGRLANFAALFRHDPARPPHPRLTVGMPGFDASVPLPQPAREVARKAPPACKACSPLDYGWCTCPQDCGHLSCTGAWREAAPAEPAPWALKPRPDADTLRRVADKLRALPAEPPAYVPDLYADIIELPVLRDVIRWHAQNLHTGCQCEPRDAADSAGWLAAQYADLRPGGDTWWTVAPVPVQDEAGTAEMQKAA